MSQVPIRVKEACDRVPAAGVPPKGSAFGALASSHDVGVTLPVAWGLASAS